MKFKGITHKSKQARNPTNKQVQSKEPKKKESKKEHKKPQFPNIYHTITEPRFWIAVVTAIFLLCLLGIVFLVYGQVMELKRTLEVRSETAKVLQKYEAVIAKYPNFRDGYLGAASVSYQLHDYNRAMMYVQKALELDPNYPPSKKLEAAIKAKK